MMSSRAFFVLSVALLVSPAAALAQQQEDGPLARNGFYGGVLAGAAFNAGTQNVALPYGGQAAGDLNVYNGTSQGTGTVGLLIGHRTYLSRRHHILAGLETDINYVGSQYGNANGALLVAPGGIAPAGTYSFVQNSGSSYYGTLRGHLGVAFKQADIYFTSGFAYAGNSSLGSGSISYTPPGNGATVTVQGSGHNETSTGSVIGGGAEIGLQAHLIARFEYLHFMLDGEKRSFDLPVNGSTVTIDESAASGHFDAIRIGLFYQF